MQNRCIAGDDGVVAGTRWLGAGVGCGSRCEVHVGVVSYAKCPRIPCPLVMVVTGCHDATRRQKTNSVVASDQLIEKTVTVPKDFSHLHLIQTSLSFG